MWYRHTHNLDDLIADDLDMPNIDESNCRCWKPKPDSPAFLLVKAMRCGSDWCKSYMGGAAFRDMFEKSEDSKSKE